MFTRVVIPLAVAASTALAALIPIHNSVPVQSNDISKRSASNATNMPLLIWHGLGDSFDSDGIRSVGELYRKIYPDSLVYAVHLADTGSADRRATFFGNVTDQINTACENIKATPELAGAEGLNTLGFSQGGVFMRGLVERCNMPPVRNLATFGSPHNGITSFAMCSDGDWLCKTWDGTLKGNTWGSFSQSSLVPAQYFRDMEHLDDYLEYSNYLADVNNERTKKNATYSKKISKLDKFIMIKFAEDDVIQPPESTWFADYNKTSDMLTKLKDRKIYTEDWLGLQELDMKGGLLFAKTAGKHMQIGDGVLEKVFAQYFAPVATTQVSDSPASALGSDFVDVAQRVIDSPARMKAPLQSESNEPCHRKQSSSMRSIASRFLRYYEAEAEALFI